MVSDRKQRGTALMVHQLTERLDAGAKALGVRAWQTPAELVAYQEGRLRRMVDHAYANVPYYRKLFTRDGIKPEHIRTLADLGRIPISTKTDLRDQPAHYVIAAGLQRDQLIRVQTTGSTGEPFALYRSVQERRMRQLFWARAQRSLGQRLSDRVAFIGVHRSRSSGRGDLVGSALRAAGIFPYLVNVQQPIDGLLAELARLRPAVVIAYPSKLAQLGDELQRSGQARIRPRFLVAGGETLSAARRKQTETSWQAPVYNFYASAEMGLMAWQCPVSDQLHVCDDSLVLEILRDGRPAEPGEHGEVVVTGLHNWAMPLIRYRLADIATHTAQACPCGQPFTTMGAIQGRMADFFRLRGGRIVHPADFLVELGADAFRWVKQYQAVQEATDRIIVRLVPGPEFTSERVATFEQSAARILGSEVHLITDIVDQIEPGPGGKSHVARSLVAPSNADTAWLHSEALS